MVKPRKPTPDPSGHPLLKKGALARLAPFFRRGWPEGPGVDGQNKHKTIRNQKGYPT